MVDMAGAWDCSKVLDRHPCPSAFSIWQDSGDSRVVSVVGRSFPFCRSQKVGCRLEESLCIGLVIRNSATEVDTIMLSLGETFQSLLRHVQIKRVFLSQDKVTPWVPHPVQKLSHLS